MEMDEIRQKGPAVAHIDNRGDPESPSTDSYQQAGQQVQMAEDGPEPKVSLSTILAVFVSEQPSRDEMIDLWIH
jgi:hypothetical protein